MRSPHGVCQGAGVIHVFAEHLGPFFQLGRKRFVARDHEEILVVLFYPLAGEKMGIVGVQHDDDYDAVLEFRQVLGKFLRGVVVVVEGHSSVGRDHA